MSPFSPAELAGRVERAAEETRAAGLNGLIITPGPDLLYFSGYASSAATERLTALLIPAEDPPVLLVPKLETADAKGAAGGLVKIIDWMDGMDPYAIFGEMLLPAGRYGISDNTSAVHLLGLQAAMPESSYAALSSAMPMLRAVKGPEELTRLGDAGQAADQAYQEVLRVPFAGRKEAEVASDLASLLRKHGHSQVDFTSVGSGPNGANPHHEAGERVISPGDVVVLDFGGIKDGYGSDTTRTVFVGDEPPAEIRRVHELVRRAQQAAFDAVRPGVECQEIDRVARQVIADGGYGEYFIHRTGHGIGLTTHEPPYMVEGETHTLRPGMCFSIEPGIYLPGRFGVRIEDIVAVTEDGGERLNNTSHSLATVS
jgi:Xaa-Pro aminopeptidase